jgi:hypothetical protein
MPCVRFTGPNGVVGILTVGGPTLTIYRAKAAVLFEMHDTLGPMPVGPKGGARLLPARHWFWLAVSQWVQQGEQLDEHRRCIYDPTIPLTTG